MTILRQSVYDMQTFTLLLSKKKIFFKICQWESCADRVLSLNITILLPTSSTLFQSIWSGPSALSCQHTGLGHSSGYRNCTSDFCTGLCCSLNCQNTEKIRPAQAPAGRGVIQGTYGACRASYTVASCLWQRQPLTQQENSQDSKLLTHFSQIVFRSFSQNLAKMEISFDLDDG